MESDKEYLVEKLIKLLEENHKLKKDAKFMRALEAAGVDNWEGYGIAQDLLDE